MKNRIKFLSILMLTLFAMVSCKKDDPVQPQRVNKVSQFVYDGMSLYYYWADEMTSKKPTLDNKDPKVYFESLLNSLDKKQGWSFITDNVEELLADFSGEPIDFGLSVVFLPANEERTEFFAFIQYVYPDTPSALAGLDRLDIIGKIDGQPISQNNYTKLFGGTTTKFSIYRLTSKSIVFDRDVTLTPKVNKTNPVLYSNIYEINGKKIAYLFYTEFIGEYNDSLYNAFEKFKTAGATDLVVDLRYNRGGGSDASIYLASLMAPKAAVENKSPFVIREYNKFLNEYFDSNNVKRIQNLGDYSGTMKDPLLVNNDFDKVYIIATGDSYSASELVTFCLKQYTNVVHIGSETGGKFTSSFTISPYNDYGGSVINIYDENKLTVTDKNLLKNWAMQPIVGIYSNRKGENFSSPGYLIPDYKLSEGGGYVDYWKPIGDVSDTFLGQAIYLITGDEAYKPAAVTMKMKSNFEVDRMPEKKFENPNDMRGGDIVKEIILTPEDFNKMLEFKKVYEMKKRQ